MDAERRVLLTARSEDGLWCLPGGGLEANETVEQCLVREVYEEIGCRVRVDDLIAVYTTPRAADDRPVRPNLVVICAFAALIDGSPGVSQEVQAWHYFDGDDLPDMVPDHAERIEHALNFTKAILA